MRGTIQINRWFTTIAVVFLCLLAGCSIHPVRVAIVNGKGLQDRADIPKLNDELYSSGKWNLGGQINEDIKEQNHFRVKYHPSYSVNQWMVVEGKLGNGKKYPVVLDTGASPALFVNDIHIVENKLAICPLGTNNDDSGSWGICQLPELSIGEIRLADWLCFYREQHAEVQIFGLPIDTGEEIIAGLPTLQKFKYIAFDSIKKEVEFSLKNSFECDQPDSWTQYPFVIEQGWGDNVFLLVEIAIAGEQVKLQLDTGSGRGLAITEELWEKIREKVSNVTLREAKDLYPYIGWLSCKRGVISKLEVGGRTVNDAKISIFPNDSDLIEQCEGLLGMQYFQDTAMVLDFERNLMWVKMHKAGT